MKVATSIILLILIPSASAGWGAAIEGGIEQSTVDTYSQINVSPATGQVYSRTIILAPLTTFAVESTTGLLTISFSGEFPPGSAGRWIWRVSWDSVNIPNCSFSVTTIASIPGANTREFSYDAMYCALTNAQMQTGTHYLNITRAVAAGTPAQPSLTLFSHHLDQYDLLEPNMTNEILEALAALAPLLLFIVLTIWAERTREWTLYAIAILAGIFSVAMLWADFLALIPIHVALLFYIGMRGLYEYNEQKESAEQ